MPAPRRPAVWANSSACTLFRIPPTTSRRCFRSGKRLRALPSLPRRQRPERQLFPNHHQRLRGTIEVVQLSVRRPREQLIAADEERQRTAVANRFVEPHAKHLTQRGQQTPQPRNRKPAPPEIGEDLELEHV